MGQELLPRGPGTSPEAQRLRELVAFELAFNSNLDELLEKLSKGDKKKRNRWRKRLVRWALDPEFQVMIANYAKAIQVLDLTPIIRALDRRAIKGNIPAIKLALEANGFHNPRVQHEHSGEVKITIKGLTRPNRTEDHDSVVDATVVES